MNVIYLKSLIVNEKFYIWKVKGNIYYNALSPFNT